MIGSSYARHETLRPGAFNPGSWPVLGDVGQSVHDGANATEAHDAPRGCRDVTEVVCLHKERETADVVADVA